MYNERKTAQMAAYLLDRGGERMAHLKLMKLLYLADREAMTRIGFPISGDRFVSMDHGPVLSMTLNLMDGDVEPLTDGWADWISDKENNELSLRRPANREALDELSDAEIEVLEHVWNQFGQMGKWEIRDYTHTLPEWRDPDGSSLPIEYKEVFRAIGYQEQDANELGAEIEAQRRVDRFFARL